MLPARAVRRRVVVAVSERAELQRVVQRRRRRLSSHRESRVWTYLIDI